MELYVRFISTLAFGLIGLGAVMKVLLETIFEEWDAFNDISQRFMASCSGKGGHVEHIRARIVDFRRRQIKELDAIENRLTKVRSGGSITDSDIIPS